jgi:peptide/nickel transport system substrate-binding protein/microcin C transport system substrate-binding protein
VFNNSEFAAVGTPSAEELKLLEPFRAELPPRVFGPAFVPPSNLTGPNALREHLRRARDLLSEAGWKVAADGRLRNARGEPFEFEYLEPGSPGRMIDFQRNLEARRHDEEAHRRLALYRRRLQAYDFDVVVIVAATSRCRSADWRRRTAASRRTNPATTTSGVRAAPSPPNQTLQQRRSTNCAPPRALDRGSCELSRSRRSPQEQILTGTFSVPVGQVLRRRLVSLVSSAPWPLWTAAQGPNPADPALNHAGYIVKRILLMLPTCRRMTVTSVIQFVPGGPVDVTGRSAGSEEGRQRAAATSRSRPKRRSRS